MRGSKLSPGSYYRLRTHNVHIPPLRDRLEDIPLLLDHYMEEAAQQFGKMKPTYPPELLQLLMAYDFPGNVRELRAMVYDAVGKHSSRVMSMNSFRDHINEKRHFASRSFPREGQDVRELQETADFKRGKSRADRRVHAPGQGKPADRFRDAWNHAFGAEQEAQGWRLK